MQLMYTLYLSNYLGSITASNTKTQFPHSSQQKTFPWPYGSPSISSENGLDCSKESQLQGSKAPVPEAPPSAYVFPLLTPYARVAEHTFWFCPRLRETLPWIFRESVSSWVPSHRLRKGTVIYFATQEGSRNGIGMWENGARRLETFLIDLMKFTPYTQRI